jgi:hypothetical protein
MEGLFPLSKTSYGVFQKCPWHLYATKILGLKDGDSAAASAGRQVHDWRAKILSGATDYESTLAEISDPEVSGLLAQTIAKSVYSDVLDQKLEQHYQNELVHGYIDRSGRLNNSRLFVEDLKTGRWELDDPMERDIYSVLVWDNDATPETEDLMFVYFYCRSGQHYEHIYNREDIDTARERIAQAITEIAEASPDPNPGAHCLSWYGQPCAFHGQECPLSADVPALIDATLPVEMAAIGLAFMAIYRGELEVIPPSIASFALQGVQQVQAAAKIVEETLKNWSDENGPIEIGEDKFGWNPVSDYDVDKTFALQAMLSSDMPIDEIAKIVNLSKTAIERISKRRYPDLRQSILDLAISQTDGTKRRFGRIKG